MLEELKIKESPKGIYVIAGLLIINGLMNLPTQFQPFYFPIISLLLTSCFVMLAFGILRHNFYAWAIAVIASGIGAFSFAYYLVVSIAFLDGIEGAGVPIIAYLLLAVSSLAIFVYLITAKIRKLFGPIPFANS
ncbi:MAG: hypothetical protein GKR91_20585 [Pseudomonadales bacterium]|nr:hypothetical protein [Pseudomonadales bacterium]